MKFIKPSYKKNFAPQLGKKKPIVATILIIAVGFAGTTVFETSTANVNNIDQAQAVADGLPTWDDVEKAKANEQATAAKITEIETALMQVEKNLAEAEANAAAAYNALFETQEELIAATVKVDSLNIKAEAANAKADEASDRVGVLANSMHRGTSAGKNAALFMNQDGEEVDDFLYKMSSLERVSSTNEQVFNEAQSNSNQVKFLESEAGKAEEERQTLVNAAEVKANIAEEVSNNAQKIVVETEAQKETLNSQLAALKDTTAATTAGYQERQRLEAEERERIRIEEERKAREAAEAAARAEAEANANNNSGGGGNTGGGNDSGGGSTVVESGWAKPTYGRKTSGYGPRSQICGNGQCAGGFHSGVDVAAPLGTPIYAASAGTVVAAGPAGAYGNMITIDHGGGIRTRYAHIRNGGIMVSPGQTVAAGEYIAAMGSTGASTGSHLHYEVFRNGSHINPELFMAQRGIRF